MELALPKESFVALAAIAWADGRISKGEGIGLVRAATASGLADEDLETVKKATTDKVDLEAFDPSGLTPFQKGLTLAVASWLARVDGVANREELDHLKDLGAKLGLSEHKLNAAMSAAFDIACLPEGHKPDKYDFVALVAKVKEKLPSLGE